ncbi:MAG: transposase [Acidobacteriia bacterium]|nr:transposase [Terriglobia bacterium]
MPYRYREMTMFEREEIVRQRRERGYPLHAPPHPFRMAGEYLITAANFEHVPVMDTPERLTEFEARLLESMDRIGADVPGWVILPNHYHILVDVSSLDLVSAVLQQLHGGTSRQWNLEDDLVGQRRVWYKFEDRMIRDTRHFYRALNYIHFNPVKHGYVSDPFDWPWSSVDIYKEAYGRHWLRENWIAHPPRDFGEGWDD